MSSTTFYGSQNLVGIGSVGIGTTSPSYALDVNGFIRTTYPLIADTTATGSNYSAFRITAGGDGQCYIQAGSSLTSAATANVLFTGINGGPERMRINLTSGNVGIGTNNPSVTLTVAGGTGQILEMRPSSTGSCYGRIGNSVITDGSPNCLIFGADGGFPNGIAFLDTTQGGAAVTTPLAFRVNGSERMRITAAGNVGIGTASPTSLLTIYSADTYNAGISLATSATNASTGADYMIQRGPSSSIIGGVAWNISNVTLFHTTNETVSTAGPTGFLWASSGSRLSMFYDTKNSRLGIGTTNPATALDVSGGTIAGTAGNTTWRIQPQYVNSSPYPSQVRIANGWNPVAGTGEVNYAGVGINLNSSQGFSQVEFYTSTTNNAAPTQRMVIAGGGNVGIGTPSPGSALQVVGDIVCSGTLSAGNPLMFRNALYNGDFRFAQRGTIFLGGNGYILDRWFVSGYGSTGTYYTVSQIQSGLANFANALQLQQTSTSAMNAFISQSLETRDVVRFQGQPATVSFWYRIPTNFTYSWIANLVWSTAFDSKIADSSYSYTSAGSVTLPNQSAWTYASFQASVPANAQALAVQFVTTNGVINGAQFQVTGVQLEKGSVATPFEFMPYATELALCQRYYEVLNFATLVSGAGMNTIVSSNPGTWDISYPFKVQKRANPTMTNNSGVSLSSGMTISGTVNANTNEVRLGLTTTTGWQQIGTTGIYISYWGWNPAGNITANAEL